MFDTGKKVQKTSKPIKDNKVMKKAKKPADSIIADIAYRKSGICFFGALYSSERKQLESDKKFEILFNLCLNNPPC